MVLYGACNHYDLVRIVVSVGAYWILVVSYIAWYSYSRFPDLRVEESRVMRQVFFQLHEVNIVRVLTSGTLNADVGRLEIAGLKAYRSFFSSVDTAILHVNGQFEM